MNTRIRLSICIPTYNRADFLPDVFGAIAAQAKPGIEVVVCDNASSDDTSKVVEAWQGRLPHLTYIRASDNRGADRNYLQSVDSASGEYCWLHGSDDVLEPHAIATVLQLLDRQPTVIATDRTIVSFDLSRVLGREYVAAATEISQFSGNSEGDLLAYLKSVRHFTGVFPFLTNLIINRSVWQQQPSMEEFVGSGWVHVAKIHSMLRSGGTLLYVPQPLVKFRSGNDSFLATEGHCRRALIDLDYLRVAAYFFGDQPRVHRELKQIVHRHVFDWIALMSMRRWQGLDDSQSAAKLDAMVRSELYGHIKLWPKLLAWQLMPERMLRFLYRYKSTIRSFCGELRP